MSKKWGHFEAPANWTRDVPYDIRERTFQFAVRTIRTTQRLPNNTATRIVAHQLIKAATSVGPMLRRRMEQSQSATLCTS